MAIPSGSGTEVLKRATTHNLNNTWSNIITGVANHIYTIVSIIITEQGGASETIRFFIADSDGSSNPHYILPSTTLGSETAFVWNDKFVITGNKKLMFESGNAANIDVICSYIDQDWT